MIRPRMIKDSVYSHLGVLRCDIQISRAGHADLAWREATVRRCFCSKRREQRRGSNLYLCTYFLFAEEEGKTPISYLGNSTAGTSKFPLDG